MPIPATPSNLGLFGQSPNEKESHRKENQLRFLWDLVADANSYDLRVNAVEHLNVAPGFSLTALTANTLWIAEVRAVNVVGASPWSNSYRAITRPPRPPAPSRMPYDPLGWGIGLRWNVAAFPNSQHARIRIYRETSGAIVVLSETGGLAGEFTDLNYPQNVEKRYCLEVFIPQAHVPANDISYLTDNSSELGPSLVAIHPFSSIGPIERQQVTSTIRRNTRHAFRMYTLK